LETVTEAHSVAETLAADDAALDRAKGAVGEVMHDAADRIGRYTILELERKVALKVILPGRGRSQRAHERLLREAQALARLSSLPLGRPH